jgi:hypothetical protein
MKKLYILFLFLLTLTLWGNFTQVEAKASQVTSQAAIDAPSSDIETVPADTVTVQQAPSSSGMGETMKILLEFTVLWSIIYITIKMVRRKLEKDRPFK